MRTPKIVSFRLVSAGLLSFLGILTAATGLLEQNIPLRNWRVDTNWRPASALGIQSKESLISGPVAFQEMDPCRIIDTRGPTGPYGAPSLVAGGSRNFTLASVSGNPCAGIPTTVVGFSLNITVTNTQGAGFIIIYPQGGSAPTVSTLNYLAGQTLANAALVASGSGSNAGAVTVVAGVSGTDIIIDINGFFVSTLPSTSSFSMTSTGSQAAIVGTNSGGVANGYGVTGQVTGNGASSAGVRGVAGGTGAGSAGISGAATATGAAGVLYGVLGQESSTSLDSAGVRGIDGTGAPPGATSFGPSGIRGESTSGLGVLGVSQFVGVTGVLVNTSGATQAEGRLGFLTGGTNYGVYAATGDIGATGTKSFVVPDPGDPGRVIRYISLEGPEVGTYFRGRATLENREAIIDVPESFRLVTEEEGLSIQVTPIGQPVSLWIQEISLGRVVVRGPRDVEFFYTVNGVRKGYADFQALSQGAEFVPASASAHLPEGLNPETKRRLIANGTYTPTALSTWKRPNGWGGPRSGQHARTLKRGSGRAKGSALERSPNNAPAPPSLRYCGCYSGGILGIFGSGWSVSERRPTEWRLHTPANVMWLQSTHPAEPMFPRYVGPSVLAGSGQLGDRPDLSYANRPQKP